jgi:hypothetical protein
MKTAVWVLMLGLGVPALAAPPEVHVGKVLSQTISSSDNGAAIVPLNGMLISAPLTKLSNIVVVEFPHHRMTLSETGSHFIVLPVNGTAGFYKDGKYLVTLQAGKRHKFVPVHVEVIEEGK